MSDLHLLLVVRIGNDSRSNPEDFPDNSEGPSGMYSPCPGEALCIESAHI